MSVYVLHSPQHLTNLDEAGCFMGIFEDGREEPFLKIKLTYKGKGEATLVTGRESP
jgi:hypothetical protein